MAKGKQTRQRSRQRRSGYYDYNLLAVVIILICFGLVMLYSASSYEAGSVTGLGDDMYYFRRQAIFSAIAIIFTLIAARINYHVYMVLSPYFFLLALVLMAMVRYTPFGVTVNGARRWLNLGGIQFQPSELAKIAVCLFLPYVIIKMGRQMRSFRAVIVLMLFGGLQAFGAYYLTDNLSTGLIIFGISVLVIFLAHPKTAPFVLVAGAGAGGVAYLVHVLVTRYQTSGRFRLQRILVWRDPEGHLSTGGYQVMQGLYAIGSGGFFGKGLGNSTQKLSTIPEAQNDMIFSIICEELGLFGAILLLILFGYLLYRLFVIAQNAPDLFGTLAVSGIFAHISLQVILNICVVLNIIPTTGVTLPFVSYGGTSVIFLMLEIGVALSVARQIEISEEGESDEYPILEGNTGKQP
ncbi:MAG: cell division protein FtsW [Eubacterium sp.]|nr:cell division protein FtsW [Eubacterium sp.]